MIDEPSRERRAAEVATRAMNNIRNRRQRNDDRDEFYNSEGDEDSSRSDDLNEVN